MTRMIQKRFQLQLLFAMVAAVSVAALTVALVLNAVQHAESFVLADTSRALDHAIHELQREYGLRLRDDSSWQDLPPQAKDLTLRAISQTVLASYPGTEGGFSLGSAFFGYSYPTHDGGSQKIDVPAAERSEIESVIASARMRGKSERVLRGRYDLVVISATSEGIASAWAMKLLPGQAQPTRNDRSVLLAALVAIAFLGAAGVLATGIGLHRGVEQIKNGLAELDRNFAPRLPERRDELGEISAAINRMARTRQRLETEIRREDRARIIGRMINRIAHEMRNPLNSIRLSLQMLAQRQEEKRLRASDFQLVIDEVDRMNRLLSDLLAFQQPRPPRLEATAIQPILADCAQLVSAQAEKQGVNIRIGEVGKESALFDEQYLRQIMLNLLLNSIEASGSGKEVRVRALPLKGGVAIEVHDNGPGLTADQMEHLFEPFYTTKNSGHGLGLAIARELAQSMGGSLDYESKSGPGATFVLQLKGGKCGLTAPYWLRKMRTQRAHR